MEKISKYIIEKLKINKDSINKQPSIIDPYKITEYKGIELGFSTDDAVKEFVKYSQIDLSTAYILLFYVIDKFENDLQDYRIKLFYSGYAGFSFVSKFDEPRLGFLIFDQNYSREIENKTGIGCYFTMGPHAVDKNLASKIIEWVGPVDRTFKY